MLLRSHLRICVKEDWRDRDCQYLSPTPRNSVNNKFDKETIPQKVDVECLLEVLEAKKEKGEGEEGEREEGVN